MRFITAGHWTAFFAWLCAEDGVKTLARTLYYAAIIGALIVLYGRGDFSTPPFVYQGF